MARKRTYKVIFVNQGKVYEIYARRVGQGNLYGFIEVEGILFGEKSTVVVDPTEERLKSEFSGVHLIHIPIHAIVRIDEVEKHGTAKIVALEGKAENVMGFPGPIPPAGSSPHKGS